MRPVVECQHGESTEVDWSLAHRISRQVCDATIRGIRDCRKTRHGVKDIYIPDAILTQLQESISRDQG
jgi:hypothetical protein